MQLMSSDILLLASPLFPTSLCSFLLVLPGSTLTPHLSFSVYRKLLYFYLALPGFPVSGLFPAALKACC